MVVLCLLLRHNENWPFHPRQTEIVGILEPFPPLDPDPFYPYNYGKFYFTTDDGRRYALADGRLQSVIDLEGEEPLRESRHYSPKFEHRYRLRGIERTVEYAQSKIRNKAAADQFRKHVKADRLFSMIEMRQLD